MFAVTVFSVPRDANDSFSMNVRSVLLPVVTPYMYITSQWQLWNIFAPDPLRRITLYRIEEETADGWNVVDTIKPGSYSWWRHATYFKYAENALGETSDPTHALQVAFLRRECALLKIAPDAVLRFSLYQSILPVPPHPGSMEFWDTWTPEWEQSIQAETSCPAL